MRSFTKVVFAIIRSVAVLWITATDLASHLVHGLPKNSVHLNLTSSEQRFHLTHSATGTAWLLWIALLLVGWRLKRYGRKQLGLGVAVGIVAGLPLLPFLNLGGSSISHIARRFDPMEIVFILLVAAVLAAKLWVWVYWWKLTTAKTCALT